MTHRSEQHLRECLESVLSEGVTARSIVVWDNASSDASARIAQTVAPGANVHVSDTNVGFAAAINQAAAMAPGADLLLLNPDAVLEPGSVSALSTTLEDDSTIDVLSARLLQPNSTIQQSAWRLPSPLRMVAGSLFGYGLMTRPLVRQRGSVECVMKGFVPFTAVLLRRSTFDALGGLDERFWVYGEDTDYCHRVLTLGRTVAIARRASARHVGGASSLATERVALQSRTGDLYRTKHYGAAPAAISRRAILAGAGARHLVRLLLRSLGLIGPETWTEWSTIWHQR